MPYESRTSRKTTRFLGAKKQTTGTSSKEPVVTVQVNVRLNCSFLDVMSLQACTYDCFCLQSFLVMSQYCVSSQ